MAPVQYNLSCKNCKYLSKRCCCKNQNQYNKKKNFQVEQNNRRQRYNEKYDYDSSSSCINKTRSKQIQNYKNFIASSTTKSDYSSSYESDRDSSNDIIKNNSKIYSKQKRFQNDYSHKQLDNKKITKMKKSATIKNRNDSKNFNFFL